METVFALFYENKSEDECNCTELDPFNHLFDSLDKARQAIFEHLIRDNDGSVTDIDDIFLAKRHFYITADGNLIEKEGLTDEEKALNILPQTEGVENEWDVRSTGGGFEVADTWYIIRELRIK